MRSTKLSVVGLEDRHTPAVTAVFNPGFGTLTVFGDATDNQIVVSRDALGVISVNGEVPSAGGLPGGFPTVFNTRTIGVFGAAGNDTIRLDETNGPLPAAQLFGGSGNDTLVGGSGNDFLHGQSGDDFLLGGDGANQLFGGSGDDVAFLGGGDDVFGWPPGDGSDRVEGEGGFDTMAFLGSDDDEVFEATAKSAGPARTCC
jgi:Ca2+-binding RTX toxin-like protein